MNPEALGKCLEHVGTFSTEQVALIFNHCEVQHVKKGDALIEAGQVCNSVFFLVKGACYQYKMNETEESIIELYDETDCIVNHASFIFQKPSSETVKAYADSEVLALTVHSIHKLIGVSPVFFQLGKILQSSSFRLNFFDDAMTPQERYTYILENKPRLIQTFPLKYIASYLKIAPETLSRVRALA